MCINGCISRACVPRYTLGTQPNVCVCDTYTHIRVYVYIHMYV
jgi:hypothetical protein